MRAALSVVGVCKRYASTVALAEVSFVLAPGSATALLGVNGAGKSTLIRAVLDLVGLDAGAIEIHDVPHHRAAARVPLAYLGERFLPPHAARGREVLQLLCEHPLTQLPLSSAREYAYRQPLLQSRLRMQQRWLRCAMTALPWCAGCASSAIRVCLATTKDC